MGAVACLMMLVNCTGGDAAQKADCMIVVGSYAPDDAPGIKAYAFDLATGQADSLAAVCGVSNPSYLAVSADGARLYSVGEDEGASSTINALSLDRSTGKMALIQSVPAGGGAPCYIALSPGEKSVVTANYLGGSVSVAALDSAGRVAGAPSVIQFYGRGTDSLRQEQPHLHTVAFTLDGSKMLATDLGKDVIYVFEIDGGSIAAAPSDSVMLRPGSGPRHIAFAQGGRHAYLINEISGYVTTLSCDSVIAPVQYVVCDSLGAQGSADIHISPDGRHLYASNRLKGDGISIYDIDSATGLLTRKAYQPTGSHPRNFAISPDGAYLLVACRDDDKIQVFARDAATGLLTDIGRDIITPKPVCVKFVE